jgi:NADPH-dependent 2,4-dienoyl-CoA reductase/sulfur reductase-like enzyme
MVCGGLGDIKAGEAMDRQGKNALSAGKPRIIVVGGVAGGASCAARARRLSEEAEIVMFERGSYVSFANCGLPYYIGDVITEERNLLVATPELFRRRFNIQVRLHSEVLSINRGSQEIEVRDSASGETWVERYDALVLAPGSAPVRPPLPGIDLPGIFTLRTIPDSRQIRAWISERRATGAVVVGGGFIGLETAENLVRRGLAVTVIEALSQVMPPIDPEMATPIHDHLKAHGVTVRLGDAVSSFEQSSRVTASWLPPSQVKIHYRYGTPGYWSPPGDWLGEECRSGDRSAWGHTGGRSNADLRPAHLGGRRCRRST